MSDNRQYYQFIRPEMLSFLPLTIKNVLEIGCGEGRFLSQVSATGEQWAVEMDSASAQLAEKRGFRVLAGAYDKVFQQIPSSFFDVVICNDVIEHMADTDWFLESIKTKLKDGGVLIGSVPNVRYLPNLVELLLFKDWRYRDSMTLDRTHLRFFTEKSLQRTLQENQFIVEIFTGINPSHNVTKRWVVRCLCWLTLGLFADTQYLQFGFRARGPHRRLNSVRCAINTNIS